MRIIFIHGFGENESIFSKVAPFIPGEHTFLNIWELLGNKPLPGINVLVFAKSLVEKYNITQQDVIIGHSMGGWIAWYIKHFTGSPIVFACQKCKNYILVSTKRFVFQSFYETPVQFKRL